MLERLGGIAYATALVSWFFLSLRKDGYEPAYVVRCLFCTVAHQRHWVLHCTGESLCYYKCSKCGIKTRPM